MPANGVFSERYGQLRTLRTQAQESQAGLSEYVLQCLWYDTLLPREGLCTAEGQALEIVAPGWWNHGPGPDFQNAHLRFDGREKSGDVEIDFAHSGWRDHGHYLDERYSRVVLHVVWENDPPAAAPVTAAGRPLPTLLLPRFVELETITLLDAVVPETPARAPTAQAGRCAALIPRQGTAPLLAFLRLAGEWRMLNKARLLRQRMAAAGPSQAIYEEVVTACGYGRFKEHFRGIGRSLPYDRARQLAQQDPLLLEAAYLQLAGLLPDALPEGTTAVPHYARLRSLRRDHLASLRSLPFTWSRGGIRPNNYPERRLAGLARFVARTAERGLTATLEEVWRGEAKPIERRRALEALFPGATGFWATHCSWTGKRLSTPTAPLGEGRVRSIIGNVFVPAGVALARQERDRVREGVLHDFFAALPKEPDNHIVRAMLPHVTGERQPFALTFQLQQGLLQMHQDWCEPNPTCRNCPVFERLDLSALTREG